MSRAADYVLRIYLGNKRVFQQHRFVLFPHPFREARLEALLKKPAYIVEIRRAEHRLREIYPVAQPHQGVLSLFREHGLLRRLGCRLGLLFRRLTVISRGQCVFAAASAGACCRLVGFGLLRLRAGAKSQQQGQRQQKRGHSF